MVRNLSIWLLTAALLGCTSSENESSGTEEVSNSITFETKVDDTYIPEDVISSIISKRRSKLSNLYSDGASMFNFKIEKEFTELKIILVGKQSSYTMRWSAQSTEGNKNVLPFSNVNQGDFVVDVLLASPGQIQVFFNEGLESFVFKTENRPIDARVEVYLDGELNDIPGVLYDIGV
ncbi:hypothetical protein [Ekhidna sp.]|uniref:hypothetical protein n=1 Tax=Ekhidna sp. TaxID=2608089 RepID=UPI003511A40E